MKKYHIFLSENFQFLEVKFSINLNRRVFLMSRFALSYTDKLWEFRWVLTVLICFCFVIKKIL